MNILILFRAPIWLLLLTLLLLNGCAISNHGVFPKLVWYWSADAVEQRRLDKQMKEYNEKFKGTKPQP